MPIHFDRRRLDRGDFIKVGDTFYLITQIERASIHQISVTLTALQTRPIDVNGTIAGIPSLIPNSDRIFYIFGLGINGGIRVQLFFPNPEPRLTANGINVQLTRYLAPYTNPWKVDFAIRNPNFPSLNVTEDAGGVGVTGDVWFFFETLWVRPVKVTQVPFVVMSDGRKMLLYRELVDWMQNPYVALGAGVGGV